MNKTLLYGLVICQAAYVLASSEEGPLRSIPSVPISSAGSPKQLEWADQVIEAQKELCKILGHDSSSVRRVANPTRHSVYITTENKNRSAPIYKKIIPHWLSDGEQIEKSLYGRPDYFSSEDMYVFYHWMTLTEARSVQYVSIGEEGRASSVEGLYELSKLTLDTSFLDKKQWIDPSFYSNFYLLGVKGWDRRQPTSCTTTLSSDYISWATKVLNEILEEAHINKVVFPFTEAHMFSSMGEYLPLSGVDGRKDWVHFFTDMGEEGISKEGLIEFGKILERKVFDMGLDTLIFRTWGSYVSIFCILANGE